MTRPGAPPESGPPPGARLLRRTPRSADEFQRARDLLTIASQTLNAVDPGRAVEAALRVEGETLHAGALSVALGSQSRVRLLAVGKAAPRMASAALRVLGPRVETALVVCKGEPPQIDNARVIAGEHPVPGPASVEAARAVEAFADGGRPDDLVLFLLSGGASSLLCSPTAGLTLEQLQAVNALLLRSGADIAAINCVRKHLETLKGGGLARRLAPARVLALVLSDVAGDRLDAIGSGPCAPDTTSFADARAVLDQHGLWSSVPEAVRAHLEAGMRGERPDTARASEACFAQVQHLVVASNRSACQAAQDAAQQLGYATTRLEEPLAGEAREVGAELARRLLARRGGEPVCLVAGGECTVTVRGHGRGGRNQELALGAAHVLDGQPGVALLSLATDGEDGTTPAAGGMVTGESWARAGQLGQDPAAALAANASHDLLEALGDGLYTGPTGGNVCDLVVAIALPLG